MHDVPMQQTGARSIQRRHCRSRVTRQIRKHESSRVAQLAHFVTNMLHDQDTDGGILGIVCLGRPPAQYISA